MPQPMRVYYWIHHIASYDGNSGVQRVTRALGKVLANLHDIAIIPVCWSVERECLVTASEEQVRSLARFEGPALAPPANSGQPLHLAEASELQGAWLLVPEVPHVDPDASAQPPVAVVIDYARYYRIRSAFIFYDLIPVRVAGYEAMRPAHEAYASALAGADLVVPISAAAGSDLMAWWREVGLDVDRLPAPRAVELAAEMTGIPRARTAPVRAATDDFHLRLVALGTVEPRKNQVRLMTAFNDLAERRPDLRLRLDVIGSLHRDIADAARREEKRSGGRIALHGFLPDGETCQYIYGCDATAFVSLAEGYGLPIVESLWQGKPCICSNVAPMSDIAAGGGCLPVDPADRGAIERAIEALAVDTGLRARLTDAALSRPLPTWADYGRGVVAALRDTVEVPEIVVVEGSRGGSEAFSREIRVLGTRVRGLRWRCDSGALIPSLDDLTRRPALPGDGDLRDLWALLPVETAADRAEAMRIVDEARGLGMRVAVLVPSGSIEDEGGLCLIDGVDLALFANQRDLALALDLALAHRHKTATLRARVASADGAAAVLREIYARRPATTAVGIPSPPTRIFYCCELIRGQPFNSGIQRVVRALGSALVQNGCELIPVKLGERGTFVPLSPGDAETLADWGGPKVDTEAAWPASLVGEWLLHPEITLLGPGETVPDLARKLGMYTASIFFDTIPLRMKHLYPVSVQQSIRDYLMGMANNDVVLPISYSVTGDLRRLLATEGRPMPRIIACPLAGSITGTARTFVPRHAPKSDEPLKLVAVGTWEPRKNYPRLLRALIAIREQTSRPMHLSIIGRREDRHELDQEIRQLADRAGNVTLYDHLSDRDLVALMDQSHATVYASWEEGFGLPVLESLWRGLPCLCHQGSSLAEVAPGGGTLMVDMLDVDAIAAGLARLADEDGLAERLSEEAVRRPIRDWDIYAKDVLAALARAGTAPGWTLPSVSVTGRARPLLSCSITTYNRAGWLAHSLPRLIEAAKPFGSAVEVVVCDNTSTDATPDVVARHVGTPGVTAHRNPANVGMLGNLGATARVSNGHFVWLLGDDDLMLHAGLEAVLTGLDRHRDVEMAYMNYAYTSFDAPEQLSDPGDVIRGARPIGYGGQNRRVTHLRDVAALNENLFTAIYACAFRRDHALRAYQQDTRGDPFSSLATCVPSSTYALAALQDRPAWWVGQPAIIVNMNVSWLRWALLWHLERMPDLFDTAELAGIDSVRLDRHRHKHCWNAGEWTRNALMTAEDAIRTGVSVARLLERCKHVPSFGTEWPKVLDAYREAWEAGRIVADELAPDALFSRYGLSPSGTMSDV